MKKITLQWRITLLTAAILIACSISLTGFSILIAQQEFLLLFTDQTKDTPSVSAKLITANESLHTLEVTPALHAKRQFDSKSILFCILITGVGSCSVYFIAGHALTPLRILTAEIKTIDEKKLSAQLQSAITPDEVGELTQSFNQMLSRLDDAFLRQKRFTANAAHELKTPLATLKTGAQVLSADSAASLEDYRDYALNNLTTINRLSSLVNDLLLLASSSESYLQEPEEIYLEPLFEAIQNELSEQLAHKNITLSFCCNELSVSGNDFLLYRSFFNLIENACKYGYPNGYIHISAHRDDTKVFISIQDNGPGIPQEHLPYIFDAFYRVDTSRSRELGGSGLGLSLVKSMVEMLNGTITVESHIGKGTCFTIVLPSFEHSVQKK